MRTCRRQSGITLTGFIVFLLVFIAIAFAAGWFANYYFAHRLFLNDSNVPAFPDAIDIDSVAGGMTWDGQNFILANQDSPWGIIRITRGGVRDVDRINRNIDIMCKCFEESSLCFCRGFAVFGNQIGMDG